MQSTAHQHASRAHSQHFLKLFEGKITRVDRYSGIIGALQLTTHSGMLLPPAQVLSHRLPTTVTPRQLSTLQSRVGKENLPVAQPTVRDEGVQVKLKEILYTQCEHGKPETGEGQRLHLPRIGGQSLDTSKCASGVVSMGRQRGKPRRAIQLQQDSLDQVVVCPQLRRLR